MPAEKSRIKTTAAPVCKVDVMKSLRAAYPHIIRRRRQMRPVRITHQPGLVLGRDCSHWVFLLHLIGPAGASPVRLLAQEAWRRDRPRTFRNFSDLSRARYCCATIGLPKRGHAK